MGLFPPCIIYCGAYYYDLRHSLKHVKRDFLYIFQFSGLKLTPLMEKNMKAIMDSYQ